MELIVLVFALWLIGAMFPGSGGEGRDFGDALCCLIAGIIGFAVIGALIFGMIYLASLVVDSTGSGWAGLATFVVLFFGALLTNRQICIALERPSTRR